MYRPRKRQPFNKRRFKHRSAPRRQDAPPAGGPLEEGDIIALLHSLGGTASLAELLGDLSLDRRQRREIGLLLDDLCRRKILQREGKKMYSLRHAGDLLEGTLTFHPHGYAFAAIDGKPAREKQEDLFIPPRYTGNARHGDRVLLQLVPGRGDRPTARVVKVLERGSSTIIGIYHAGRATGMVEPDDDRFPFRLRVRRENSLGAANGMAVLAEILTSAEQDQKYLEGKIVRILGDPDDLGVQTEMVINRLDLPVSFSAAALDEADRLDSTINLTPDRRDLREVFHITIDGETARDFDDAVCVVKDDSTYTLYVSIADVSHYVKPGSNLDREAYQRGTSVYFPNRVLPMLPERLSNDLCSLVPNRDRYAFTAVLRFSGQGKLLEKSFAKSVIRSRYRMTYTLVKEMLLDKKRTVRKKYADLVPMLEEMAELGAILEKKRRRRGSIGFELPEAQVLVSEDGKVADIGRRQRNLSHKIIEEFMLAANEAVAETHARFSGGHPPLFLYRIHEPPDPTKAETFAEFAASLGLRLPHSKEKDPAWFGAILEQVISTPREYIISNLMLRVMQQARYAPENEGHFGLAAKYYTHFTSPIRRYPDLLVHRALAGMIGAPAAHREKQTGINAHEAGEYLSRRERLAVEAERDIQDRVKVLYMADKIDRSFAAIVSGVTSFGIFVELLDHFVSGAIAITDLKDDYYRLDEKLHRLTGSRTGRTFQIGDAVTVRLVSVDRRKKHVNFVLSDERI
jgi:ribonuclease R